jgi:hypothetical protein
VQSVPASCPLGTWHCISCVLDEFEPSLRGAFVLVLLPYVVCDTLRWCVCVVASRKLICGTLVCGA